MADRIELNAGTGGAVLSTDEVTKDTVLQHVQYVKLMNGTADAVDVIPGDATNGLTVNLGTNNDVTVTGTVTVDGSGVTQPVSAASLPLPSGASTAANQTTVIGHLDGVEGLLTTIDADTGAIAAAVSGTEMRVDVVAALPAGTNNIGDVDVLSVVPGTGATNLGKAIDTAAGATDTGMAVLAVRDDSLTTLTPVDGDYVPLRVSSTGALHVTGGGGGTEYSEDAATPATIAGTATMMERDDALSSLTPVEGDWAAMRCDANGALWTAVSGEVDVTPGTPDATSYLPVRLTDGSAFLSSTSKAVDDAAGGTDSGIPTLAVRDDSLTTLTPADGDYVPLRVNSTGALHVTGGGGGTQYSVDDAGPTVVTMAGAVRDDSLTTLTEVDGDASLLRVNSKGALYTIKDNDEVDANNSTTSTLTANTDYTGTGTDLLGYAGITITIFADQNSDANGLRFEFSSNNTNWDISQTFDYAANSGRQFQFSCQARYFRVAFQNAGTGQTAFRLQTILHREPVSLTTVHRADADIAVDRSATLVKSVLMAQAGGSGDFTPVQGTAGGNLKVSVTEISDGLDVGAGNAGGETIRVSIASNDVNLSGILADTAAMDTNLTTLAGAVTGTEMQVDVVAALPAGTNNIGDVDVLSVVPGTGATNLGKAIDTATGATDTGVLLLATRDDALAALTPIEGDNVQLRTDANGALWVIPSGTTAVSGTVTANLAAGTNNIGDVDILSIAAGDNNIGNVDIVTMPNVTLAAGTNTNEVVGDVAHDAAASGNPLGISGVSQNMDDTAPPNRVSAEGDATRLATSWDGSIFAHPHGPQIWSYHVNGSSALTDTTVHASPGAGLCLYVTDIVISSGAATAMNAFFEEGSTTVLGPYYLEAVAGRGCALQFNTPKKITAATALTVTTSAAIAHSIDMTGFIAPG